MVKVKFGKVSESLKIVSMIACKFFFYFLFLLTAPIVENSHILAKIYFTFLKTSLTKLKSPSIPNLDLSEKIGKAVIK